ncbi:MAG: CRISPR-associated endonuclease Cas3'' [Burkholderiaceae bacterium]
MSDKADNEPDLAHAPLEGLASGINGHQLDDHLRAVSRLAASFGGPRDRAICEAAGLWHDLGKRRAGFQRYIRQGNGATAHIERVADSDKTHSAAGAIWAAKHLHERDGTRGLLLARVLQYIIAGHHAGLDDWEGGLSARLAGEPATRESAEALARPSPEDILRPALEFPEIGSLPISDERSSGTPGRFALWVRIIFSALVDADFLDTEAYFDGAAKGLRGDMPTVQAMRALLRHHLDERIVDDGRVNRARAEVLNQCRIKAHLPPGVFSLTVPTGGGKTLSGLSFALEHAVAYGKRRVIVAIPYTSIIEQTADVFRQIFSSLSEDAVIEHHSNAETEPERETARSRLACENWDAPLVVTTNVQLFESLFARRTSRCRKLHNLRDSVIVLDEAQLLPVEFLQPVVDVLRYLVQDFGVTLLLCTATQPALDAEPGPDPARGLRRGLPSVTEIIDDVPALYQALERVEVYLPPSLETPRAWEDLADEVGAHDAVLVIVSRRADAAELYRLLVARVGEAGCWHLSALMCAQHRSDTIAQIKVALDAHRQALAAGTPAPAIRVVSTQLVEAGVDLDFPVVYRALAGLDSIAQAAGRCNREGRLAHPGEVHVFVPPTDAPPGLLTIARQTCRRVLSGSSGNPFSLELVQRYFRSLYFDAPSTDRRAICEKLALCPDRQSLALPVQFRAAADAFRLIDDDDQATVLVRYRSSRAAADIDALIGLLERDGPARWLMRKLQRFGVALHARQIQQLLAKGDIAEVASCPGLYAQREHWDGLYHPVLGLRSDSGPGDPAQYFI